MNITIRRTDGSCQRLRFIPQGRNIREYWADTLASCFHRRPYFLLWISYSRLITALKGTPEWHLMLSFPCLLRKLGTRNSELLNRCQVVELRRCDFFLSIYLLFYVCMCSGFWGIINKFCLTEIYFNTWNWIRKSKGPVIRCCQQFFLCQLNKQLKTHTHTHKRVLSAINFLILNCLCRIKGTTTVSPLSSGIVSVQTRINKLTDVLFSPTNSWNLISARLSFNK